MINEVDSIIVHSERQMPPKGRFPPDSWKRADLIANRDFPRVLAAKATLVAGAMIASFRQGEFSHWSQAYNAEYQDDQITDVMTAMDAYHTKTENNIKVISTLHPDSQNLNNADAEIVNKERIQNLWRDTRDLGLNLIFDWIRATEHGNSSLPNLDETGLMAESKSEILQLYFTDNQFSNKAQVLEKAIAKLTSLFDTKDPSGVGESYHNLHTRMQLAAYRYGRGQGTGSQLSHATNAYMPTVEAIRDLTEMEVENTLDESEIPDFIQRKEDIAEKFLEKFNRQLTR